MSYQVIKLSNGEDIVCNVLELHNTQLKITAPLKMDTISKETGKGFVESLALSRWVQPYSDEETFTVERNSIVIMTPASHGLARYYEYVLQNISQSTITKIHPTRKELKVIEEEQMDLEEELVSSEDLQAILDNFTTKKTIH
jgi:hypothetical protein